MSRLFFATRVAELSPPIEEMPYALNASPAVLPEFSRLRRRDACSRAELYDVCNACADGHLCHTRAHGNICDAAYHDGNPLALADDRIGAICRRRIYSLPPALRLRTPLVDAQSRSLPARAGI
jgi:hypothetical protein